MEVTAFSYKYHIYIILLRYHQHEVILSLPISEMLNCISSDLKDSNMLLLPRLYLQPNNSANVQNRLFNDSQNIAFAKILNCVPDDRFLASVKSGKLCCT